MVERYPHKLYKLVTTPGTQDSNGDWTTTTTTETLVGDCRADPSGGGSIRYGEGDATITYTFDVYMATPATLLAEGATVVIKIGSVEIFKGTVLRQHAGQTHYRIWV